MVVSRANFFREVEGAAVVVVLGTVAYGVQGRLSAKPRQSRFAQQNHDIQSGSPRVLWMSPRTGPTRMKVKQEDAMLMKDTKKLKQRSGCRRLRPGVCFEPAEVSRGRCGDGRGVVAAESVTKLTHPTAVYAQQSRMCPVSKYTVPDQQTPFAKATSYNNFKKPGRTRAIRHITRNTLHTRPWTVEITGLVKTKKTVDIDSLLVLLIESRVYRHRCVEAWSLVIPWDGYSLSELINWAQPLPGAKFVQFISDEKSSDMPDKPGGFDWPYSEGLRMDEAMNPLCLLSFGCYGQELHNQNGAPVRVVSPWKYGFKNAKSIVKINFTDKQPHTLWNDMASNEYGFYSNVNPSVDHPRVVAGARAEDRCELRPRPFRR